jgi:hypothetical protein
VIVTVIVTDFVAVTVTEFVAVIVEEFVIVGIPLYFRDIRQGKEREFYPPSSWRYRIRELELPLILS